MSEVVTGGARFRAATPSETIRFPSSRGHELAARLDLTVGESIAFAIFARCFTCSKNSKAATHIGAALAARGIAVFRFDFGLGETGGDFSTSNFGSNVEDILAAAAYLRGRHAAPQRLIGYSLGGTAVLTAAHEVGEVRAMATLAAPNAENHIEQLLLGVRDQIWADGEARVDLGGRPFTILGQFLEELARHDASSTIGGVRKPLLILHSPIDRVVAIDNAAKIFAAATHPKNVVSLHDSDRLLSRSEDSAYAAELLAAWASRNLSSSSRPSAINT